MSSPAGLDCRVVAGKIDPASTCDTYIGTILSSLTITLTFTPSPGSVWYVAFGDCGPVERASPCTWTDTFTASGPWLANPQLRAAMYTLTATKSGVGSGTVTSDPPGIACGGTCSLTGLLYGAPVTLNAKPDAGAVFNTWTGACNGQGATCKLTLSGDTSTNAVFQLATSTTTTTSQSTTTKPLTTTTAPTTTTTTTTATTIPTSTSPAPPSGGNSAAKLTARLSSLSVRGHGSGRSLRLLVRVSASARGQLQLLRHGFERAHKLVSLHSGTNTVQLALPPSLEKGSYRLKLIVRSGKQQTTASALITLAAVS